MKIIALFILIVAAQPHRFSMLDFWEKKCKAGNVASCERLESSKAGVEKLARLDTLARKYGDNVKREALEKQGKPLLNIAYRQVMDDFIKSENEVGNNEIHYDESAINYCADHFHNYWVNKKLWWPTDVNGNPGWTDIYYYIIDHYYGICLRRYFNQR